jgi:hypothetical protein
MARALANTHLVFHGLLPLIGWGPYMAAVRQDMLATERKDKVRSILTKKTAGGSV